MAEDRRIIRRWNRDKDGDEKDRRSGKTVDIHILASRRNTAFWVKDHLGSGVYCSPLMPPSPFPLFFILITYFILPLINFISPCRRANTAVLVRFLWQLQLLGNTQLSIIHSRSLTDGEGECQGKSERNWEGWEGGLHSEKKRKKKWLKSESQKTEEEQAVRERWG